MNRGAVAGLALLALVAAGHARSAPSLAVEAVVGAWRAEDPFPLRIDVVNDGGAGRFELRVFATPPDEDFAWTTEELELAAGARKTIWVLAQTSRNRISVELRRDGAVLSSARLEPTEHRWSSPLVAVLGDSPPGLRRAVDRFTPIVELRPSSLPPDPLLWPELEVLVWPEPRAWELEPRQAAALRTWLREGGRLIAGTHPEDPGALAALGLSPPGRFGWGSLLVLGTELPPTDVDAWIALLGFETEPPAARRHGPAAVLRDLQLITEGAVSPPVAAAVAVVAGVLVALGVLSLVQRSRIAAGLPLVRRRLAPSAVVLILGTIAGWAVGETGSRGGRAVARHDLIDLDLATGELRAQSLLVLRRARPGLLSVDTLGAGRLCALGPPGSSAPGGEHEERLDFDGRATRLQTEVASSESLRLQVRWSSDAVSLPAMPGGTVRMLDAVGAGGGLLARRGGWSIVGDGNRLLPAGLDDGRASSTPFPWTDDRTGLADFARDFGSEDLQWRWPTRLRWPDLRKEEILVVMSRGAAGPPLLVDGRDAARALAFTTWRIRMPSGGAP